MRGRQRKLGAFGRGPLFGENALPVEREFQPIYARVQLTHFLFEAIRLFGVHVHTVIAFREAGTV